MKAKEAWPTMVHVSEVGSAWIRKRNGIAKAVPAGGLIGPAAAYQSVLAAVRSLSAGTEVCILCDSSDIARELRGERQIFDAPLVELAQKIRSAVSERSLRISFLGAIRIGGNAVNPNLEGNEEQ